jgi:site-specific DNA-methyltransferase (adenine-specific)
MIFDEIKLVLKPTGACWVNIGDTYSEEKSLIMIPSRFAIAMTERGWILRNEIIWYKTNAMPSSATDRFTVDFEKMFFFTKKDRYYFRPQQERRAGSYKEGRNVRCVWAVPTSPSADSHVAMYPPDLIEVPIKACCPPGGTVIDPFVGSGTTLEVCRHLGVNGIGIDINPRNEEIIIRRSKKKLAKLEAFAED